MNKAGVDEVVGESLIRASDASDASGLARLVHCIDSKRDSVAACEMQNGNLNSNLASNGSLTSE